MSDGHIFDSYLPRGGVGVRTTTSGLTLIESKMKRIWWKPWRKRLRTEPLAHAPHVPQVGERITLTQEGSRFLVESSVAGVMLRYPPDVEVGEGEEDA